MNIIATKLGILLLPALFLLPTLAVADEVYVVGEVTPTDTIRFDNENWFTLPQPKVASFTVHADGSMDGVTETGVTFSQYNVPTIEGIRVQRFEIQDHYHYIIDGEIAETFEELSARLALAYLANTTS